MPFDGKLWDKFAEYLYDISSEPGLTQPDIRNGTRGGTPQGDNNIHEVPGERKCAVVEDGFLHEIVEDEIATSSMPIQMRGLAGAWKAIPDNKFAHSCRSSRA